MCTHCGILGHSVDKCYKIHGYPPNYGKSTPSVHHVSSSDMTQEQNSCQSQNLTPMQVQQLLALLQNSKIQEISSHGSTEVATPAAFLSNTNTTVTIAFDHFTIQDSKSQKMIGRGELQQGLYILKATSPTNSHVN
ncbi:hypothetical protein PIB30_006315 [Stylosanthes scabra]|uniref:Uncharacterized protein n=1 Tax=Stylosanthes scabra TaxID=79078 RepID=A0ABU6R693_9FABA|nr:hypothetical protein [Stylosanthes scabra]